MASRWDAFIERYANEPFYWFQPKGFTIKPANLLSIREKLRLLRPFDGKPWHAVQKRYTDALRRKKLFVPRRARRGSTDYAAIVRMNKEVFDSLGLIWVGEDTVIQVTEVGKEFLRRPAKALPDLVAQQLRRYMYPNPAVGRAFPGTGVFPYLAMLAVLTHFPQGVPVECYELFISRVRADEDVQWAVEHIEAYSALAPAKRERLLERLQHIPVVREGRIVARGRRTSLLNTIHLNRPYMLSLLATPALVKFDRHAMEIDEHRFAEAEHLVQSHMREDFYIRFPRTEDWIAFYGDPSCAPTATQALDYYRSRGDVDQALELFREPRARKQLPAGIRSLAEGHFRKLNVLERTLEDFLEFNLDLLEHGLKLIGRQYPTPTGPLDLLVRDVRGSWVVIELKRGRAADRAIGQLLRYMAFIVKEQAKGKRGRVRGFVVAGEADKGMIQAAEGAGVSVEVFEFAVQGKARRLFPRGKG